MEKDVSFIFPNTLFSGERSGGHVQGIAVDEEKGFVYFSFTTVLIKTDFKGAVVGSVVGIVGHLGCITFDSEKRKIYGSLEFKHDGIGKGIAAYTGHEISHEDAFYCACFDCDKIVRENMDAERDGIMTAVYLPDVAEDYSETDELNSLPHRYGCSGIDGIALGPEFGSNAQNKIMIAYGIYSETDRKGNDYQIILQFDRNIFEKYAKPLNQMEPHHSGASAEKKYFFFTGNTEYGIQNLEYDKFTNTYIAAVYSGFKKEFVNYPMFFIDAGKAAEMKKLFSRGNESGLCLKAAVPHSSVDLSCGGCNFPWGQTGLFAFGDGRYAFSHGRISSNESGKYSAKVVLYKFDKRSENIFEEAGDLS